MVPLGLRLIPGVGGHYAFVVGYSVVWLAVGYVATRVRPAALLGRLMMVFGLVDLIGTAGNAFYGEGFGFRFLHTAATVITLLQGMLVVQMAVTYPHGRATDRATTWFLRGAWAFAIVDVGAVLSSLRRPAEVDLCSRRPCTEHLFYLVDDDRIQDAIRLAGGLGWALTILAGIAVLAARWLSATSRVRRSRALPVAVAAATGVLAIVSMTGAALDRVGVTNGPFFDQLLVATLLAVPVVFLIGLVRERLDLARISDLVRQLGTVPLESLRPALAAALGDPRLEVVVPPAAPAAATVPGRTVTPVGDPAIPAVLLVHDTSLNDEPRLLEAVRAAVALAVESSKLRAELHHQLAEVRASRARLVEAGDAARRLERDLHDGAQQRLIAAGLALRAARIRHGLNPGDADADRLLQAAEEELRSAIADLRELARGIHPAVLTEQGLRAAVEQLVGRQRYPINVHCGKMSPLPAQAEATAYFVVCEALTNVDKHAAATRADLTIAFDRGSLQVVVSDDGVGGAVPSPGSGLAGLADRVAAANGTIDVRSPAGGGTTLTVVLPCSRGGGLAAGARRHCQLADPAGPPGRRRRHPCRAGPRPRLPAPPRPRDARHPAATHPHRRRNPPGIDDPHPPRPHRHPGAVPARRPRTRRHTAGPGR